MTRENLETALTEARADAAHYWGVADGDDLDYGDRCYYSDRAYDAEREAEGYAATLAALTYQGG